MSLTALAGTTERVSKGSMGVQGNGSSNIPSISADGRFVAFASWADNLIQGDTNGTIDIFVNDRLTGHTERISEDSAGIQGNESSRGGSSVSVDGRFVAFVSMADNLVDRDTNDSRDVFVNDRLTGRTERVSEDSTGVQGNNDSFGPSISADGRFVAFASDADNLVERDTNGESGIFVNDRLTGLTERVSVDSMGIQGNGWSHSPSISADGRFVAFTSYADNLVKGDTNDIGDIFVYDRLMGRAERVSKNSAGIQGDGNDWGGLTSSISADGRFVAFNSHVDNLVWGDTNGWEDVFVNDRLTGRTELISENSKGFQGRFWSERPSISADGRFVAFESYADNLVKRDTNGREDVFVHDRLGVPPPPEPKPLVITPWIDLLLNND